MRSRRLPRSVISLDTTRGNLSLMELMRPPGILAISVSLTASRVVLLRDPVSVSTIPQSSPRPNSPTSSFRPHFLWMTLLRRPLSTT